MEQMKSSSTLKAWFFEIDQNSKLCDVFAVNKGVAADTGNENRH